MKSVALGLLSALVLLVPTLTAQQGFRAQFVGGTLPGVDGKFQAVLDFSSTDSLVVRCGVREFRVDYAKINSLEYGQTVSRRYAAAVLISPVLLLSKSRKHFVTVGYEDPESNQQVLVFRVDKGAIRSVLASLEARSGRRVEFQDDEARKGSR